MMMSLMAIVGLELVLVQLGRSTCPRLGWYVDIALSYLGPVTDMPLVTSKLGDMFLKNVYHSLNEDRDEITFAKLK